MSFDYIENHGPEGIEIGRDPNFDTKRTMRILEIQRPFQCHTEKNQKQWDSEMIYSENSLKREVAVHAKFGGGQRMLQSTLTQILFAAVSLCQIGAGVK